MEKTDTFEEVKAEEITLIEKVVITDIKMPFWSMVIFMIKWSLASIAAVIALALTFSVFGMILGTLFSL